MFEPAEIDLLKSKLPQNHLKPLKKKTGLSYATLNRFFNYIQIRRYNAEAIYDACLEVIQEFEHEKALRKMKMRSLTNQRLEPGTPEI